MEAMLVAAFHQERSRSSLRAKVTARQMKTALIRGPTPAVRLFVRTLFYSLMPA
jgi:hypothetical protein